MTLDDIKKSVKHDQSYIGFITAIENGFANTRNDLLESIRSYWRKGGQLKVANNIALMDDRIVIPSNLCKQVLYILHSAHQGIKNMRSRAN